VAGEPGESAVTEKERPVHDLVKSYSALEGSVEPLAELLRNNPGLHREVIEFAMALGVRAAEYTLFDYVVGVEKLVVLAGIKWNLPAPRTSFRLSWPKDISE
jgi:hypothetical protein